MSFLLLTHVIFGGFGASAIFLFQSELAAVAFAAGAGVSLLNLIALVVAWPRILAKKLIALSIGVIVFKFAILGWIIYEVVTRKTLPIGWFSLGLGVVILSVVITSFMTCRSRLIANEIGQ